MALGMEVGLGPGHIVLDEDPGPSSPAKGAQPPPFSAHVYCGHGRPALLLLSSCYRWSQLNVIALDSRLRTGNDDHRHRCRIRVSYSAADVTSHYLFIRVSAPPNRDVALLLTLV